MAGCLPGNPLLGVGSGLRRTSSLTGSQSNLAIERNAAQAGAYAEFELEDQPPSPFAFGEVDSAGINQLRASGTLAHELLLFRPRHKRDACAKDYSIGAGDNTFSSPSPRGEGVGG